MKVIGGACGVTQEGTAFEVKAGVVVTNAHVIAGEASPQVDVGGVLYPATPVFFDPELDLALLRTSAPMGKPLTIDPTYVGRGTEGAITGFPKDGPQTVVPAGVAAKLLAEGRDIYNQGLVIRNVYELDGVVLPGNSGSPLVGTNGEVIGVVFSRSTSDADVGYALASPDVLGKVVGAENRTAPVSTQNCSPD